MMYNLSVLLIENRKLEIRNWKLTDEYSGRTFKRKKSFKTTGFKDF